IYKKKYLFYSNSNTTKNTKENFNMLSSRLTIILRELMTAERPITATNLANLNQVTTRTIREDIKRLDTTLSDNVAYIDSIMRKGYKLKIINDRKLRKFLQSVFRE